MDSLEPNNTTATSATTSPPLFKIPLCLIFLEVFHHHSDLDGSVQKLVMEAKEMTRATNVDGAMSISVQSQQKLEQRSSLDLDPMNPGEEKGGCTGSDWLHNECPVSDSHRIRLASNEHVGCKDSSVQVSEDQQGVTRHCLQFGEQPTATTMLPYHYGEKSLPPVLVPSAFGLPLNSTINATQMDCGGNGNMKPEAGGMCMQGLNLAPIKSYPHQIWSSEAENVTASLEGRISLVAGYTTSESFCNMQPVEQHSTLHARETNSEHVDSCEEFNQESTKKKRKKSSNTISNQGCKPCNCRTTKCIKLYCVCFSAGIFCDEHCTCKKGCFNTTEYEDTVFESRQHIEAHDPLAFAPAIIDGEDGNRMTQTQSSRRHKRGCNCKKSMCQKKYCECYKANVGCSSGCRCDGCKNPFGRKEDYGATGEIGSNRATEYLLAGSDEQKLGTGSLDPRYITPMMPLFNYSDRAKDALKSGLPHCGCLLPSLSGITVPSSYTQQMDYNIADTLTDVCDHSAPTPPSHPAIFMASSALSKANELISVSPQWNTSLIAPMSLSDETKNLEEFSPADRLNDFERHF